MSLEMFPDLKNLIDVAQHPVIAVIVADGCEHYKGMFLTDLEEKIKNQSIPVHLHIICYSTDATRFPAPLTQAVYYFSPQKYEPLFYRHGANARTPEIDINIALKMIQGMSYLEAAYSGETREQYEKTEEMVRSEDTSNFPSIFQQARNFAKEMWHSGKNAAQGLPVLVDANTAYNRFQMCQSCEFLKTDSFRCEKCGCFMKTKTQLASASCPIGKWTQVTAVQK